LLPCSGNNSQVSSNQWLAAESNSVWAFRSSIPILFFAMGKPYAYRRGLGHADADANLGQ
jgi:hypothetical protein